MIFVLLNVIGLVANIYCGSASIAIGDITDVLTGKDIDNSAISYIVLHSRIPAAATALLTGASLGVCGLLLQSYFRNPLAGPSILGITSGANLAVAICTLGFGMISGFTLTMSAMAGAMLILLILLALSKIVRQAVTLLIVGILISYLTNAIITLLNYYSTSEGVQSLLIWGMGNFNGVGSGNLLLFAMLNIIGIASKFRNISIENVPTIRILSASSSIKLTFYICCRRTKINRRHVIRIKRCHLHCCEIIISPIPILKRSKKG